MKVLKKLAMNFEAYLCAIAIAVMSVVVFVQVVFRFIVKSSLPWSEELSRYLQVYITFFGTAYGIQTGAHLGIEAFTHLLPKGGRKVLAILVQIVSMLVCTLILKLGVDIVMSQMASGQVSPAMRIPYVGDLRSHSDGYGVLCDPLYRRDLSFRQELQQAGR